MMDTSILRPNLIMKKTLLTWIAVIVACCAYGQTFSPTYSISTAGTADNFKGGYTFAYSTSGTPWSGALMSFGGAVNNYDCQFSALYGGGGNHLSFRTHNGDYNMWNPWFEIWNTSNLNRADVDFTAKTINSTNVYNNGNLWSRQVKVALVIPWADYVFDPTYKLPALSDLIAYIRKNHHLPDVPSAAEVEKNGIDLGEMNTVLVQKVEELTLYLIEKDQQATEQGQALHQQQINRLIKQVEALQRHQP